jgi:hypothetical protein
MHLRSRELGKTAEEKMDLFNRDNNLGWLFRGAGNQPTPTASNLVLD